MYILFLILIVLLASTAYAANQGAPWVPTRKKDIERFLNFVEMKPGEKFYELGCGDARLSIVAVRKFGARAVGVELSLPQLFFAFIRKKLARVDVRLKWANLFKIDLSDADIVYLFLMPEAYAKIKPKLERELKPGARAVTYVWPIVGWEAERVDIVNEKLKFYLYKR